MHYLTVSCARPLATSKVGSAEEKCSDLICVYMHITDSQAKPSAAGATANGTAGKAKAGKVVFGATGNRLLDKQQANNGAKPPASKPEVTAVHCSRMLSWYCELLGCESVQASY